MDMRQIIDTVERLTKAMGESSTPSAVSPGEVPVQKFAEELRQATTMNPFNPRMRVLGMAFAEVAPFGTDVARIHDIRSGAPGEGQASALMKLITSLADKYGITLELTAKAYEDDAPLNTQKLVSWYMRNGFERDNYDSDPEYDDAEGVDMTRKPRSGERSIIKLGTKMHRPH